MKRIKYIAASDLAELGYCEKKIVLGARLGSRTSRARRHAQIIGDQRHQAFHRDATVTAPGAKSSEGKPWCFIASEVFGPHAQETLILRRFRDRVLRQAAPGRAFIRFYYRHSPTIAWALRNRPALRALVATVLRAVVHILARWPNGAHEGK